MTSENFNKVRERWEAAIKEKWELTYPELEVIDSLSWSGCTFGLVASDGNAYSGMVLTNGTDGSLIVSISQDS